MENVIQLTGLCAVHEQPAPAVMAMLPEPAVDETEAVVGEILYPQPAAWVTVTA